VNKAIQIDEKDNVATLTRDAEPGDEIEVLSPQGEAVIQMKMTARIPSGHKVALQPLERGSEVIKYDEVIGLTTASISMGTWVHTHNMESGRLPSRQPEVSS
jgi:hypothetical protein